jgi:hypothetical protein
MEIIKYSEEWKDKWDSFILSSNNGTMFHMQKFLDYHPNGRFKFDHLMYVEKDEIKGVVPGAIRDGVFESPIGASYGSVVTPDIKFEKAMEYISMLLEYGKKNGFKGFELTAPPMVYEEYPNQNLDYAMLWQGFNYSCHYISSAIKLDKDRDIIQRFSPTIRKNVRRSLENPDVTVEINDRYDQFYPILIENKARHDVKPTHSLQELYRIKELLPNNIELFMVYYKGEPIAGSCMFFVNKSCALCFYNMLKYDYQHLKPIQRVMYEVVKYSTEKGYNYVDIGVSQDTKAANPMTPSMSLIEFKEKFDAKTIMRNTLSIRF